MSNKSLSSRIDSLSAQLERLSVAGRTKDESETLQKRIKEVDKLHADLKANTAKIALLKKQRADVTVPKLPEQARLKLASIKQRFESQPNSAELTSGKDWTAFLGELEKIVLQTRSGLTETWAKFVKEKVTTDTPDTIEAQIAKTPANLKSLQEYRRHHLAIRDAAKKVPESAHEIDHLLRLVTALGESYQRFDFDVPEPVKKFLHAINAGGAPLELYSSTVQIWLAEGGTTANYRIVAKQQ